MQRLVLDGARRQPSGFRERLRQGVGARVVAGDGGIDQAGGVHQAGEERLVHAVGGGLLLEDGWRPAVGGGVDGLVVPVRAFHQAHLERHGACASGLDYLVQVRVGVAEVSLHHDAGAVPRRERPARAEHALEGAPHHVAQLVLLGVHAHPDAGVTRGLRNADEPRFDALDGAGEVHRGEAVRERGELERELQRRQSSQCGLARQAMGGQVGDQAQVALDVGLRLHLAQHGLAQEVEGGGASALGEVVRQPERGLLLRAHDEARGEEGDRAPDGLLHHGGGDVLVAAHAQHPAQRARDAIQVAAEVFAHQAMEFLGVPRGFHGGEDIDEAQHARAEGVIAQGVREEPIL